MPQRLKAQDTTTGEIVEFDWLDTAPPTEADLEEVFAEHRASKPQSPPVAAASASSAQPEHRGWFGLKPTGLVPDEESTGIYAIDGLKRLASPKHLPTTVATLAGGTLAAAGAPIAATIGIPALIAAKMRYDIGGSPSDALKEGAMEGAMGTAAFGVPRVLGAIGRYGVRSALKKGSATPNEIDDLVQTSIYEGITPSRHGYNKADQLVKRLTDQVKQIVATLPQSKTAVDMERAMSEIAALRREFLERGRPDADIRVLDSVANEYLARYGKTLNPNRAQKLKTGLQEQAAKKGIYEQNLNPAQGEAQGALASGLRAQLEELTEAAGSPVAGFNQRASKLIGLRDAMVTNEPPVHPAAAIASAFGGPKVSAIQIGARPAVQAAIGRRLARVGQAFDPRYMGVKAPVYRAQKQNLSLDQYGIPEEAGERFVPDALDAVGVPVSRGSVDESELWMRRYQPEPVITHIPEHIRRFQSEGPRGLLPPAPHQLPQYFPEGDPSMVRGIAAEFPERIPRTLDQLGIPEETARRVYEPNTLDALDIPETRELYSPEELWIKKFLEDQNPQLRHLPFEEMKKLLQSVATQGSYGVKAASQPAVRDATPLTKDRLSALYRRYLSQK